MRPFGIMAVPARVGRYEIKSRIGGGGMGTLYLARDTNPTTDRLVALKLLNANLEHADLRARFEREARSLAALSHPNIVIIHDSGEYAGAPFIVMEYVRGESIAEKIRRAAPLSIGYKLQLIAELCDGLAHAHAAGIVHRDIKPANLMIDQHGRLKILDFGIARADEGRHTQLGQPLTRLHMAIGTPGYMSPEQIEGLEIDHRSDLFSAGTVFYELLTYREAFSGATTRQIEKRVMHDDPPAIESLVPGIDPRIVAIVAHAMKKDSAERAQSARELHDALLRVRAGLVVEIPSAVATPTPVEPAAGRESRRRRAAEWAYQRAVAAQADGALDFARRSALEALAEDAGHAGARDLLGRLGGDVDVAPPVGTIEPTEVVTPEPANLAATLVIREAATAQAPVTRPWQPDERRWVRFMPLAGAGLIAVLALGVGLAYRDYWLAVDEDVADIGGPPAPTTSRDTGEGSPPTRVEAPAASMLTASLRDAGGVAVGDAEVTVNPGNLPVPGNGSGTYVLDALVPGPYAVTVRHRTFRERTVLVDVAPGSNRQEIVLDRVAAEPDRVANVPDRVVRDPPAAVSSGSRGQRTSVPSQPMPAPRAVEVEPAPVASRPDPGNSLPATSSPSPSVAAPPVPAPPRSAVLAHDALEQALRALDQDGDVDRAERLLVEGQRLDPESKEIAQHLERVREIRRAEVRQRVRDHVQRAQQLFREAGDLERAMREVDAALRLLPSDPQAVGLRNEIQKVMNVGVKKPPVDEPQSSGRV